MCAPIDALVPYVGSGVFMSVDATFSAWAERDGCAGDPQPCDAAGLVSSMRHADFDVRVIQWTMQGMGHCWPGDALCPFGASNVDIDANAEMWAFFRPFALPWRAGRATTAT